MVDGGGDGSHGYTDAKDTGGGPESGKPTIAGGLTAGWH